MDPFFGYCWHPMPLSDPSPDNGEARTLTHFRKYFSLATWNKQGSCPVLRSPDLVKYDLLWLCEVAQLKKNVAWRLSLGWEWFLPAVGLPHDALWDYSVAVYNHCLYLCMEDEQLHWRETEAQVENLVRTFTPSFHLELWQICEFERKWEPLGIIYVKVSWNKWHVVSRKIETVHKSFVLDLLI